MILLSFFLGCSHDEPPAPAPAPSLEERVKWSAVQTPDQLPIATLPAEIIASPTSSVNLAPPTAGRILRWLVRPGEPIDRQQALAEMASPELAGVNSRVSTLTARVAEQSRAKDLAMEAAERGITSRREAQAASAQLAESRAALSAARAELRAYGAAGSSGTFVWRAPMSGVVGEIRCAVGTVSAEQDCVSIQHDQNVLLQVRIPERYLGLLEHDTTAHFTSLSGQEADFSEVGRTPALDPRTRSLLVQYRTSGPSPLQGSAGRATIRTLATAGMRQVPVSALTRMDGEQTVFVRGAEGPEPRHVRVHARDAEVAVVDGLTDVDQIAITGVFLLKSMAQLEAE